MLSKDIIKLLNEQVNKEMNSSNLYMSMSSWCYTHSLDGAGLFLFDHAAEEYEHAKKLIVFLNENNVPVQLTSISAPEHKFESLTQIFQKAYEHEQHISESINNIVDHAIKTKIMRLLISCNGMCLNSMKKKCFSRIFWIKLS